MGRAGAHFPPSCDRPLSPLEVSMQTPGCPRLCEDSGQREDRVRFAEMCSACPSGRTGFFGERNPLSLWGRGLRAAQWVLLASGRSLVLRRCRVLGAEGPTPGTVGRLPEQNSPGHGENLQLFDSKGKSS